ncbi:MAG: alpha-glucosidase/alpha-galactosidase [Rhodobacteraceae bacterium]|nr:alpha-glucosidase/alpha-galactosidase [Paracoccaceae bacterium]
MNKIPKITFIGAGSTIFLKNIMGDILMREELQNAHISLMDIDKNRLEEAHQITNKIITTLKIPATVSKHLSQEESLSGSDFVIVAFQIGGYKPCTVNDFAIPKQYGLEQTIGDTLGIGGIMRGLRTVPYLLKLCEDMTQLCPDAIMLQYVNPMAINCWALEKLYPKIKVVGLCHSVPYTVNELAEDLNLDSHQIQFTCAGINHMAFFLKLEQILDNGKTKNLYPELLHKYQQGIIPKSNRHNPRCPNIIRYDIMQKLGYFVTESSEHFAEYVPWYIKKDRPDLIAKFKIPIDEYLVRCEEQITQWQEQSIELEANNPLELSPSHEYASDIIHSVWTGKPSVIYGNVPNYGLISNLPHQCVVEVPCLVDKNGIQPIRMGAIPIQLAALMRTNINVQELTVESLVKRNRQYIYQAAIMDPHTSSILDLDQIWNMVDDLLTAHQDWLPQWTQSNSKDFSNISE